MPNYKVIGDQKITAVEAGSIEDAAQTVKQQVPKDRVVEVDEATSSVLVKEVVTG